ncbi:Os04g0481550, partial [Oryza sativa Japonica Group]
MKVRHALDRPGRRSIIRHVGGGGRLHGEHVVEDHSRRPGDDDDETTTAVNRVVRRRDGGSRCRRRRRGQRAQSSNMGERCGEACAHATRHIRQRRQRREGHRRRRLRHRGRRGGRRRRDSRRGGRHRRCLLLTAAIAAVSLAGGCRAVAGGHAKPREKPHQETPPPTVTAAATPWN